MPFPLSPINGQTTTTNNITYSYNSTLGVWNRVLTAVSTGTATTYTTTATAPSSPRVGDIWYQSGTDIVYRYEFDGTSNYWIDFNGPTGGGGSSGGSSTPFTGGTVANVTTFSSTVTHLAPVVIGTGTTTATQVSLAILANDAIQLPIGTTAQRPANPQVGMIRYNTSGTLGLEVFVQTSVSTSTSTIGSIYQGTWTSIVSPIYTINYLVVAGGGGGGSYGGGGGAGGVIQASGTVLAGQQYLVTVGAGGAGTNSETVLASQGLNSSIALLGVTAIGGGYGGTGGPSTTYGNGGNGGSGGGASTQNSTGDIAGTGTPGQGYGGGLSGSTTGSTGAGGGGGAGGNGVNGSPNTGGAGGTGTFTSIITTSISSATGVGVVFNNTVYFGGGGGGEGYGSPAGTAGLGGLGGGGYGAGNPYGVGIGGPGTAYTGGGGGGSGANSTPGSVLGGTGGSGVVIISYANANQRASGGQVTSYASGSTQVWVHIFTATNYFTA